MTALPAVKLERFPLLAAYQRGDRYDPTRTTALRNAFARDMAKRFRWLRGQVRRMIVDEDCFGLRPEGGGVRVVRIHRRDFDFPRSQDKIAHFMDWLGGQVDQGILQVSVRDRLGTSIEDAWTNVYIEDSYKRGVMRARYEMERAGHLVPRLEETGGITGAMMQPPHADRLGVLYTRTFTGLRGITQAMDHQISQVLAQGIADGDNPMLLARKLNKAISGIGADLSLTDTLGRHIPAERRAKLLARTEVIRAHHQGMMQEYRNFGMLGVRIQAEWQTAGDLRVCPECLDMEMAGPYTLEKIEGMIPLHPQCRCVALPLGPGDEGYEPGLEAREAIDDIGSYEEAQKWASDRGIKLTGFSNQDLPVVKQYLRALDDVKPGNVREIVGWDRPGGNSYAVDTMPDGTITGWGINLPKRGFTGPVDVTDAIDFLPNSLKKYYNADLSYNMSAIERKLAKGSSVQSTEDILLHELGHTRIPNTLPAGFDDWAQVDDAFRVWVDRDEVQNFFSGYAAKDYGEALSEAFIELRHGTYVEGMLPSYLEELLQKMKVITSETLDDILTLDAGYTMPYKLRATLTEAWESIPAPIKEDLVSGGVDFKVGKYLTDGEFSYMRGKRPRGWTEGTTWDSCAGFAQPERGFIRMSERVRDYPGIGEFVAKNRDFTLIHECGHILDYRAAITDAAEFIAAYEKDVGLMTAAMKRNLRYGLQVGKAGREEAFAESFAQLVLGRPRSEALDFINGFPNVSRYIARKYNLPYFESAALEAERAAAAAARVAESYREARHFAMVRERLLAEEATEFRMRGFSLPGASTRAPKDWVIEAWDEVAEEWRIIEGLPKFRTRRAGEEVIAKAIRGQTAAEAIAEAELFGPEFKLADLHGTPVHSGTYYEGSLPPGYGLRPIFVEDLGIVEWKPLMESAADALSYVEGSQLEGNWYSLIEKNQLRRLKNSGLWETEVAGLTEYSTDGVIWLQKAAPRPIPGETLLTAKVRMRNPYRFVWDGTKRNALTSRSGPLGTRLTQAMEAHPGLSRNQLVKLILRQEGYDGLVVTYEGRAMVAAFDKEAVAVFRTASPRVPRVRGAAARSEIPFQSQAAANAYARYYQEYSEEIGRLVSQGLPQHEVLRKMQNLARRQCDGVIERISSWQGDTRQLMAMSLKMKAYELENWGSRFIAKGMDLDHIKTYASALPDEQYLRFRAINQAYFNYLEKPTFKLWRGTEGNSGEAFRRHARELAQRGESTVVIEDANLSGYSSSRQKARNFGSGGICTEFDFPASEVFCSEEFMTGLTGRYDSEREWIIFGFRRTIPINNVELR